MQSRSQWAWLIVTIAIVVVGDSPDGAADDKNREKRAERVRELIRELAAPQFSKRQAAQVDLVELGFEALAALEVARASEDREVRDRAGKAIEQIESRAVAALAKVGGKCQRDYKGRVDLFSLEESPAGRSAREALSNLRCFPHLTQVWLQGVGDDELEGIGELTSVTQIHLSAPRVTDRGMPHLKKLVRLKTLNLGGTSVTGRSFDALSGLTDIEYLALGPSKVDNEGFPIICESLRGSKKLRALGLFGCKQLTGMGFRRVAALTALTHIEGECSSIDDSAFPFLCDVPTLQALRFRGTPVTERCFRYVHEMKELRTLLIDYRRSMDVTVIREVMKKPGFGLSLFETEAVRLSDEERRTIGAVSRSVRLTSTLPCPDG